MLENEMVIGPYYPEAPKPAIDRLNLEEGDFGISREARIAHDQQILAMRQEIGEILAYPIIKGTTAG